MSGRETTESLAQKSRGLMAGPVVAVREWDEGRRFPFLKRKTLERESQILFAHSSDESSDMFTRIKQVQSS